MIGTDGTLAERSEVRLERLSATRWQVGEGSPIEIDDAGLPVLDGGETWPLELARCKRASDVSELERPRFAAVEDGQAGVVDLWIGDLPNLPSGSPTGIRGDPCQT